MLMYLAQMMLAKRNDEDGGWVQLLIFIIVAIFYSMGGLLKAKGKKNQEAQQKPAKPGLQPQRQQKVSRLMQLRDEAIAAQRRIREAKQAQKARIPEETDILLSQKTSQELEEKLFGADSASKVPPKSIDLDTLQYKPNDDTEDQLLHEQLVDFSEPDNLRKAIIYSEILGKPIALRDLA
jgi:hypothetical protein